MRTASAKDNHGLRDVSGARQRSGGVENPLVDLTPRQSQMLSLLAKGKTYNTIAEELGVSYKTVVNNCLILKRRLGAKNLSELIRAAVRLLPAEP